MIEVRWHGRGGQGAVTASEILAEAAIREGLNALAYPEFGAERRGAPVKAYTKIASREEIIPRTPILEPDVVVVMDPSLLALPETTVGLKPSSTLIINTSRRPWEVIKPGLNVKVVTLDATKIAIDKLGKPIVNTALLGALIKHISLVRLEALIWAIKRRFPSKLAEPNIEAMMEAFRAS